MFAITLWLIGSIILAILLIRYHWLRRHLYIAAQNYSGPPALPVLGNALSFWCKNEEILFKIHDIVVKYENPIRFWLGPKLLICFSDAIHVEKILSSSKFSYKHEVYDFLKCVIGEGLISASGPNYKNHKRIIQPLFNLKFSIKCTDVFQKHIDVCMDKLEKFVDKGTFEIRHTVHKCFVDIIGEVFLGLNINSQMNHENDDYLQAFVDMYEQGFTRIVKAWLHPDFLYNLTSYKTEQDKLQNLTTSFLNQAITESWTRRKLFKKDTSEPSVTSIIDQIAEFIEHNPGSISGEDFVSHLATIYSASEDTLTLVSAMVCVCLGMYPEYQKKAAEEIRSVFGETPRAVTYEDMNKVPYLDMCIKDVLRIIAIAPYIMRRTLENYQLEKWTIPKGSAVVIPIFNLHRDKKYWENPHHFHPDHFLPENVKKRHVFSYLPFSAGPRACIGKVFANIGLKFMMCNLLQRFEVEADGKFPDLKLRMDISVRPVDGCNVTLKKRIWR